MYILIKIKKKILNINMVYIFISISLFLFLFSFSFLFTSKTLEAAAYDDIKHLLYSKCVELMSDDSFYNSRELKNNDSVVFGRGRIVVNSNGKYGIVSNDGAIIVEAQYDSIILDDDVGLRYIVKKNGKYGLIDYHGRILINVEYDFLTSNRLDSFYLAGKNEKYGIINAYGKEVVPIIYDELEVFKHELYKVTLNDKVGVVDAEGKIIVPIEYDDVKVHHGFNFIVQKNEKFGLFTEGNIILASEFDDIKSLGRDYYSFRKDGKVGIAYNGNIILDREYDFVSRINKNIFLVYKNSKFGLVKYVDNELVFVLNTEYDLIELKDRSWNDIEYSISSDDYHFMEASTDEETITFDRLFYERDIIVFKKDDRFGLIKINYFQKEDDFIFSAIYDHIEIIDRYVIDTHIYSEPVEIDVPMSKYFIVEKDGTSHLLNDQGLVVKTVRNGDMIFHWGSLEKKAKKTCSSYIDEKDLEKLEQNRKKAFIIASKDRTITVFIDEKEEL